MSFIKMAVVLSIYLLALVTFVTSNPDDYDITVFDASDDFFVTMPEKCLDKQYCFLKDNYPFEIIEDLLKDIPNLEVAKDEDVVELDYVNRQGGLSENDCRTKATTDPIYYIVDQEDRPRVVVQMKDKFEQRFSVMWCDKDQNLSTGTTHFLKHTVEEFQIYCENNYVHYDFLVLSLAPDFNGKWKIERARTKDGIPVCCVCKYHKKP